MRNNAKCSGSIEISFGVLHRNMNLLEICNVIMEDQSLQCLFDDTKL